MDLARPFAAVSGGLDVNALVVLAGSTMPRSGREVARRTGRSNTGVQHALDQLVEHGLVDRVEAGRTYLYTLNRNHLLAPAVEQMAEVRTGLIQRLRDEIGAWRIEAIHASLFGSAARGDGDTGSDVDLFVVLPDGVDADDPVWREQSDGLADAIFGWTGNHAGIAELSESELPRLRRERPPIVAELRKDAIDLGGKPLRSILGPVE